MSSKTQNKISIFYTLIILSVLAVSMIFLVNNIITVNSLAIENNKIRNEISQVKQTNDFLMTEIEKLQTYERISKLAEEKLGLRYFDSSSKESNQVKIAIAR